jgi:hypothetical protein
MRPSGLMAMLWGCGAAAWPMMVLLATSIQST